MILRTLTALLSLAALTWSAPVLAQSRTPLNIDGKSQLYQRVLVREATPIYDAPDGNTGAELSPLQPLYVYDRDGDWVEIAANDAAEETFWVPASAVVDWNQNIVVTFEGSENLQRLMFFSDIDGIYDVVEAENPATAAEPLIAEAEKAEEGGARSETVVALGPEETVDLRTNLYVMPILESEEAIFESGTFVNLLRVAVARAKPARPQVEMPNSDPDAARENFKAAVVFVVDTTISMQPYIEGTREALEAIYREVNDSEIGGNVSFGLVGYRDNTEAAPGLEYDVKTFVNLNDGFDGERFAEGIAGMTEARATSKNFREDSYAGIEFALRTMDWSQFGARFIVLVTDAGPREADDELSATGLSASGLNNVVKEDIGAAIAVMHLRTERGASDHDSAEAAYRSLTQQPNLSPLYFPIEGGDPGTYREEAQRLAKLIVEQVGAFRSGDESGPSADVGSDAMAAAIRSAGRTMQLAYLGQTGGVAAPDVFEAYVADRDFARPNLKPLSIRLLLNKAQLSDLSDAIRIVLEKAEENIINPDQFFDQVLGAAADMSRRPDKVSRRGDTTIAEAVAVDEYLDGLPYKSRIMGVTEDDWVRMSISEQQSLVNELYDKLERYQRYNEATDQWVDYLGTGQGAQSLLYPMQLNDLP